MFTRIVGLLLLLSFTTCFAIPPGLAKKGTMPSGLGNTPPGWSQGLKKGWNKDRNWRFDKKTKYWENKDWRWDNNSKTWQHGKNW